MVKRTMQGAIVAPLLSGQVGPLRLRVPDGKLFRQVSITWVCLAVLVQGLARSSNDGLFPTGSWGLKGTCRTF